jgi:hypothetical protein
MGQTIKRAAALHGVMYFLTHEMGLGRVWVVRRDRDGTGPIVGRLERTREGDGVGTLRASGPKGGLSEETLRSIFKASELVEGS